MLLFLTLSAFTALVWLYIELTDATEKGNKQVIIQAPAIARLTRQTKPVDQIISVEQAMTCFGYFDAMFPMLIPLAYTFLFIIAAWFLNSSNNEILLSIFLLVPLSYGTFWLLRCSFHTDITVTLKQVTRPPYSPPNFRYI
jgi:hypothetical protein